VWDWYWSRSASFAPLDEFRARIARIENRAIFEIPQILERILTGDGILERQFIARGAVFIKLRHALID
jgi:hypothetical protein